MLPVPGLYVLPVPGLYVLPVPGLYMLPVVQSSVSEYTCTSDELIFSVLR